ncbi:DUF1772 domain-containing protein [Enterovirga aerilata]|uniref:DUF1772 domain-containing protein n=1 Tax=Enterovirga aerilata TaxID=2730920 RepID=A0A849I3D6_9HYPH|nr:DUF1772 domain-containing protein [Enterovirga sp. DB1703]NNM73922.1 DUF1772 domain-containing protein [Enterovirga sp. DB1703]
MAFGLAVLIFATLFAGAALYISLVEHPARLGLHDAALLAQWQPSYNRALPIQAGLAVVGSLAGILAWYSLGGWPWLIGSVVLAANWPFTLLGIMPTNKRLMATRPQDAGPESRALLLKWGNLHAVRSALGTAATLIFAAALLSR